MTAAAQSPDSEPKRKRSRRRAIFIGAQIVLGLGLGLVITEVVFAARDEGAFPHVNFYVEDAQLGVRLQPNAEMRFHLRDNPVTTIHVNAQGYRGEDWPAPGSDEILVLGDSQVFGLGVDDDETFSAALARATGRTVINAGVPTYGPPEYLHIAEELLEQRKAKTVVVVLNFLNDPFELDAPNVERHGVWDGWAVRRETMPEDIVAFPGRHWLYSKSHAFYALRRFLHEGSGDSEAFEGAPAGPHEIDFGTPSEGLVDELVADAETARRELERAADRGEAEVAEQRAKLKQVEQELAAKRDALDELLAAADGYRELDQFQLEVARGRPGDIVEEEYAEEGRSVQLTAALIRKASRMRQKHLEKLLAADRQRKGQASALVAASSELVAERAKLREAIARGVPEVGPPPSMFDDWLGRAKALCDRHGARLVVVALPFDVQIDPSEWDKYGVKDRPDMTDSLVLLDDLVRSAGRQRIAALDASEALRGAQPGAFLDHDIHMTPKGHAALARALQETLARALPPVRPEPGLPAGTTFVPADADWDLTREAHVSGSTKAGCTTHVQGSWFKLVCKPQAVGQSKVLGLEVREGAMPATMSVYTEDGASLVTPLVAGRPVVARIWWEKKVRELRISWPDEGDGPKFRAEIVDVENGGPVPKEPAPAVHRLCLDHREVFHQSLCRQGENTEDYGWVTDCDASCGELWGDSRLAEPCRAAFPDDAAKAIACLQNDPLFAPPCPEGEVHAFASNRCFAVCDPDHPCQSGTCTPWQGSGVCS